MLVTIVAVLCNAQLCLEKVVTNSEQSGITMAACSTTAQIGIADWRAADVDVRHRNLYLSSQMSSMRQPLYMLLTMIVRFLTLGAAQLAPRLK